MQYTVQELYKDYIRKSRSEIAYWFLGVLCNSDPLLTFLFFKHRKCIIKEWHKYYHASCQKISCRNESSNKTVHNCTLEPLQACTGQFQPYINKESSSDSSECCCRLKVSKVFLTFFRCQKWHIMQASVYIKGKITSTLSMLNLLFSCKVHINLLIF